MKKILFYFVVFCAFSASCFAQNVRKEGGITSEMLSAIVKQQTEAPINKALRNAIAANSIDILAVNSENAAEFDTHFSIETPKQSITNQNSSGRCWMFTGFNVLRGNFAKKHADTLTVDLSQNYLFFWDQLEKANLFLQGVIDCADKPMEDERVRFWFQHPISDGGTFCGVADLVDKYGLVPHTAMPESYSSDNTSRMDKLVTSKLREQGLQLREAVAKKTKTKALQEMKTKMLGEIYHMLSLTLGVPPTEFSYAFKDKHGKAKTEVKTFTPKSFAAEVVGAPLNGTFMMVMNDPRRDYYKTYEVEWDRHTYDGQNWKYLNLPMNEIEELAIATLKDDCKIYSSYDVGKQLDKKRGYADTENYDYASLMGTTFPMNKAQRIMTFDSGSTHAMTLTAVDLNSEGKATKWKVENSWGSTWGQSGYLIMTARWFNEYMFRLVIDKQYVPERLLKLNEQAPIMVMPEDPLFAEDE